MGNDRLLPEDLTITRFRALEARVRELEEEKDALMMSADTDALTGLFNARGLERRTRLRDWGWYVAADLDGFKRAQDAHPEGHAYGDRILREFADFLLENTRQGDARVRDILVGRKGGDEFLVWCETRAGARRIRDAIRDWHSADESVCASAGLGQDPDSADAACYVNKTDRTRDPDAIELELED